MKKISLKSKYEVSYEYGVNLLTIDDLNRIYALEKASWELLAATKGEIASRLVKNPRCYYGVDVGENLLGSVMVVSTSYEELIEKKWIDYCREISRESDVDTLYVGSLLGFIKNGVIYPKYYGFDKKDQCGKFLYFNLCYYSHVQFAIKHVFSNIYYATGAPVCKMIRGCEPNQVYSLFDFNSRFANTVFNKYISYINNTKGMSYEAVKCFSQKCLANVKIDFEFS